MLLAPWQPAGCGVGKTVATEAAVMPSSLVSTFAASHLFDDEVDAEAEATMVPSSSAPTIAALYLFDEEDDDLTTTTSTNDDTVHGSNSGGSGGNTVCQSVVAIANSPHLYLDGDKDDNDGNDITFVCKFPNGDTVPITATPEQVTEIQSALYNGTLVSAVSTIVVEEVIIATEEGGVESIAAADVKQGDGELMLMVQEQMEALGGGNIESVMLPPGSMRLRTDVTNKLLRHHNSCTCHGWGRSRSQRCKVFL